MEAKLADAIGSHDWYSAHQLLISLAQRHQRARRLTESKALLATTLQAMCPADRQPDWPPLATVVDIAEKYLEVVQAAGELRDGDEDVFRGLFAVVLAACAAARSQDDKHTGAWMDVSAKLIAASPAVTEPLYKVVLGQDMPLACKTGWAVEHVAQWKEQWGPVAELVTAADYRTVLVVTMQLLAHKSFGSAAVLLKGVVARLRADGALAFTSIDDASGALPSFLVLVAGPQPGLDHVNAAQLFFAVCQRKSPPKALFGQLRDRFGLAKDAELDALVELLTRQFSPQPKARTEMNPMMSMFQSMMGGAGMPGMGLPPMTPPKKGSRKPPMDLD